MAATASRVSQPSNALVAVDRVDGPLTMLENEQSAALLGFESLNERLENMLSRMGAGLNTGQTAAVTPPVGSDHLSRWTDGVRRTQRAVDRLNSLCEDEHIA